MMLTAGFALLLLTLTPSLPGIQSESMPAEQEAVHSRWVERNPGPRVRRRLCPDVVTLYLGEPGVARRSLRKQAQALADAVHRPVRAFAWSGDSKKKPTENEAKTLANWILEPGQAGKTLQVFAYGRGNQLAQDSLTESAVKGHRIQLVALESTIAISLPGVRVWRIQGKQVQAPGARPQARIEASNTAKATFANDLARLQRDEYGKALDPVLLCKEKLRYPRRQHLFGFRVVADADYTGRPDRPMRSRFDLDEEQRRLDAWLDKKANQLRVDKNPRAIALFNRLPAEKGGPLNWYLDWYPMYRRESEAWKKNAKEARKKGIERWIYEKHLNAHRHFLPINMHEEAFLDQDLDARTLGLTSDYAGRPCLYYRIRRERAKAYSDFTERNKDHYIAILLSGRVRVAPQIMGRIPANGLISGAFTQQDIKKLIRDMKAALPRAETDGK